MEMKKTSVKPAILSPTMTMSDLMRRYPPVISLLLRRKMACVGCDMAAFDTLAEAAATYDLDLNQLMMEINQSLAASSQECPA